MSKKNSPLDQVIAQMHEQVENVSALRVRVAEISEKIRKVGEAPINLEDFGEYLRKWISARGAAYGAALNPAALLSADTFSRPDDLPLSRCSLARLDEMGMDARFRLFGSLSVTARYDDCNPFDMLCFFFPEMVFEKLRTEIKTACGAAWPDGAQAPIAERRKVVAELARERDGLTAKIKGIQAEIDDADAALSAVRVAAAQ
jgi:hypothetical protein